MCDQTEISYLDGEVVWVKLGNCWWPGEVVSPDKLSPDVLRSYRKPPIAIVKFFQEDAYEFVKNINSIYKYQCSRKEEFINKGLSLYRTKHGHMEKFPDDVIRAETKVGGDIEILTRDEFQETKKESYAGLFGTPAKKTSGPLKRGKGRQLSESPKVSTPVRRMKEKTDYKVHILVQGSKPAAPCASPSTSTEPPTPSTSTAVCPPTEEPTTAEPNSDDKSDNVDKPVTIQTPTAPSTPSSGPGIYACHACSFTTTRLNVLILHNKSHSVSFMPYTPSPIKKKIIVKSPVKSTPNTSKRTKQRKPRKEKIDTSVKTSNKKRLLEEKISEVEKKKLKTDEEIKSSLLADWDDDVDDESNDESATAAARSPEVPLGAQSPEVPLGAESPAEPTAADLPAAQVPVESSPVPDSKSAPNSSPYTEKPEASSDSNKYEFCEDEDWPVEADAGRKIPRVKNPVRTEETKSISIDEDDMAREVAELLNKTVVPDLPSVPEPLKVEENFPEPSIVKSPDKKFDSGPSAALDGGVQEVPPTKAIFKTKTFFRSRHSRSQDAIGKYVAEQLNNVEKMDIADCDLNGSDNVSSPEARDSPPIEHVKVARLAPKIQLKKMKAEAQLREKERNRFEPFADPYMMSDIMVRDEKSESPIEETKEKENSGTSYSMSSHNVLYPTAEIIPISDKDLPTKEIKMNVCDTNYDASTEGEDTCETIIEEGHGVTEESESSQETFGIEISQEESGKAESNQEVIEQEVVKSSEILYQENINKSIEAPGIRVPEQMLSDTPEPTEPSIEEDKPEQQSEPFMNESTASAVDALLSVSREADRVTRTISDDPPEDLFEDDNKDGSVNSENNDTAETEEETEIVMFPQNDQEVVMTEEMEKETDLSLCSANEEHSEHKLDESENILDHGMCSANEEHSEHKLDESETVLDQSMCSANEEHSELKLDESENVVQPENKDEMTSYFEDINKEKGVQPENKDVMTSYFEEINKEKVVQPENKDVMTSYFDDVNKEKVVQPENKDVMTSYLEDMNKEKVVQPENKDVMNSYLEDMNKEKVAQTENKDIISSYFEDMNEENVVQPENKDEMTSYFEDINKETDKYMLPENEEKIPETNVEPDNSVLSTHAVNSIQLTLDEESDKNGLDTVERNHAIHEASDNDVFPENEAIPTIHEESNTSAFFNNEEISAIHEETANELHIPETHKESEHVMIHSGFSENEEEIITTQESEVISEESVYLQNEEEIPAVQDETEIAIDNNPDEYITTSEIYQNEEVVTTPHNKTPLEKESEIIESTVETVPSESDLQIAEALINLPATALQSQTPTEQIGNHVMTSSFELDNVQEEIIQVSEQETVSLEKVAESINKLEEQSFNPNDDSVNVRFETEQEKCEDLNAAQSLLHMAESIEHTISIPEAMDTNDTPDQPIILNVEQNNGIDNSVEQKMAKISSEIIKEPEKIKKPFLTSSSKLLQILEEPSKPRFAATKITPTQQIVMRGKEKILNFDVAKSSFDSKPHSPNQKIIIRRATPSKTILNNMNEIPSRDKIILTRSNLPHDGSSIQRFMIQTAPDSPAEAKALIIQQKIKKLANLPNIIPKIKRRGTFVPPAIEAQLLAQASVDNMFDINSMPIVLSEDLITGESIEKMPVVMSDANINPVITQPQPPPKPMKPKINITENEKITVTSVPKKQEIKSTLLLNSVGEVQSKSTTPNILSKSAKLRAAKPMLVIDKTTGKQKIVMTKAEPTIKEVKQIQKTPTLLQKTQTLVQNAPTLIQKTQTLVQKTPTLVQKTPTLLQTTSNLLQNAPTLIQAAPQTAKQSSQAEKFIILPTQHAARPGRTQKIVIDPQTGKAHMILSRGKEASTTATENKPVSAKLVPSKSETNAPGNTVMIITNAQGAQSRIVLTPEHEKILFPNKQQQKGSQLKTIAHRITTASALPQLKTVLNPPPMRQIVPSAKTPARIVPKQKNAIITSKGQLIVGGRVATTAQNIAPMPEVRQVPKRLALTEPRKLVQAIQKTNSEPIIYLQQKSGAVMQLTASQFEQLQRTGQIVQKTSAPPVQERVIIQKSKTIVEAGTSQKSRVRKTATHSPTPAKKSKHHHEIAIAPAPLTSRLSPLLPALTPIVNHSAPAPAVSASPPAASFAPSLAVSSAIASSSTFSEFDNFEEMLPSTAIARQPAPEPAPLAASATPAPAPEPAPEPTAAALADGQLLAVPGEHFGGPLGSFYLCVEENGTYTPIDNRPLVLENNQLMPMSEVAPPQPERRDILSAALANSDVFHADAGDAADFRDLNANVSVHCRVSETSSMHQPIMTPAELPRSRADPAPPGSLEDGLAVIGVTPLAVPTSLELPITVTDPRIAPRTSDPLGGAGYGTTLMPSPGAELCYVSAEESVGPISMPLLTEEEDAGVGAGGKSMPILTDEVGDRTVSSVESARSSPASLSTEADDGPGATWTRRLLTPCSDSDLSAEIPLQPSIQLSVGDLSDHT